MIGGMRINVTHSGDVDTIAPLNSNRFSKQRRSHLDYQSDDDSGNDVDDDEGIMDYLANITSDSENDPDNDDDDAAFQAARQQHINILRRLSDVELGDDGAVEDVIHDSCNDNDDDNDDAEFFIDGAECDNSLDYLEAYVRPVGTLSGDQFQTSMAMQYPVQTRSQTNNSSRKQRSAVKGAQNGKLLPGEKAHLRKEAIKAKRASRAAYRGFDLSWINQQLELFVQSEQHVLDIPGMQKHECSLVKKLAALYGCKTGLRTGQGSKKKKVLTVTTTERTRLPMGDDLLEIARMLALHNASVLGYFPTKKGGNAISQGNNTVNAPLGHSSVSAPAAPGRWNGIGRGVPQRTKKVQMHSIKPVVFVPGGVINNDDADADDNGAVYGEENVLTKVGVHVDNKEVQHNGDHGHATPAAAVDDDEKYNDSHVQLTVSTMDTNPGGDVLPIANAVQNSSVAPVEVFEDRGNVMVLPFVPGSKVTQMGHQMQENAIQYTRLEFSTDGIANSGRLLGLGMALGLDGTEIFGGRDREKRDGGKKRNKKNKKKGKNQVASDEQDVQGSDGPGAKSREYAGFERYTTGIGSKLLAKWGFAGEGSGLGKNGDGISEPIQVQTRAKRLGLGA